VATTPPGVRGRLDHLVHTVYASGLDHIQLVAGCVGLAGGVLVLLLVGRDGGGSAAAAPTGENAVPAGRRTA
jgi:hypothetical protein